MSKTTSTSRAPATLLVSALVLACSTPGSSGGPGQVDARPDAPGLDSDAPTYGFDVDTTGFDGANPYADLDFDEVPDLVDNCPGIFNPNQADSDGDGIGDLCDDVNDDTDGDGIPDENDPFPGDPSRPGRVNANTVYAHTSTELFYLGIKQLEIFRIGTFKFPSGTLDSRMTDIAVDRYGVLWGIGFEDVFIINPSTAEVWRMAALPQEFNGLTLIPRAVLGTERDVLVGISVAGGWWRLDLIQSGGTTRVQTTLLGSFGSNWTSSGDAFSIEGVGTFASVKRGGMGNDQLVEVDPKTGLVTRVIAPLGSYNKVWGLAGWANRAYGFDEGGDIFEIDLSTGQTLSKRSSPHKWWGAGVKTILDAAD
jgi:hypothetical protein